MVEYALGVGLVAVVSLGALQALEDNATDNFNDRADRSGAPDLAESADGGGGSGGSGSSTDGTDDDVPTVEVFFDKFDKPKATGAPGKPWTASIQVVVVDGSGKAVSGARVNGTWTYTTGTETVSNSAQCDQTQPNGACLFQLTNIPLSAGEVVFRLDDISGGVPPVEYNGGSATAPPISNPHPVPTTTTSTSTTTTSSTTTSTTTTMITTGTP